jgi:amino acid adenylation domain-containing protein
MAEPERVREGEEVTAARLAPQQRRLWLLQEAHGPLAVQAVIEIREPFDRAALDRLVARHDALRTSFATVPGMRVPVQEIAESGEAAWNEVEGGDLDDLLERERRAAGALVGPPLRALRISDRGLLVLTLPALCADLGSLRNLVRELAGDLPGDLPRQRVAEDPVQSWQYAEWLGELLEEADAEEPMRLWRERLAALDEPARLPFERDSTAPWRAASLRVPAPPGVREAASALGVPAAAFLLAAWRELLRRSVGDEPPLAAVLDGRELEELEGSVGPFARAVPLRLRPGSDSPFAGLAADAAEALAEAAETQRFFVWEPSRAAARDLRRPPFFPFGFENRSAPPRFANLAVRAETAPCERFRLGLVCTEGDEIALELTWDAERWSAAEARRAAEGLVGLLASAVASPRCLAGALIAFPPEIATLDRTAAARGDESLVHERIARQAERTPDAHALVFGERRISYAELVARARALAHRLVARGVGPEVRVGLALDPSAEAVVALLAVLEAGGAFVPVDPHGPEARRAFLLDDSGARIVLGKTDVDLTEPVVDPGPVASGVEPENLAYVLYTSGSTGVPKGVGVEHRQLSRYLAFVDETLFADAVESCPFLTPLTFDAALKQTLGVLLRGGTVWGLAGEGAPDPADVLRGLAGRERAAVNATPTLWRAILDEIDRSRATPAGITRVFLGGERLDPELFERTAALLPGARVWNLYGPTEATANAAAGVQTPGRPVTLGRPIDGALVRLLDRFLQPVPPGAAGELFLGGAGISRGYPERPELTAERFVPDPFGPPGTRLYRSGDLGRLTPDGEIEYLGRTDRQIKLRGYRIELGEIEARLEQHPDVREAAVSTLAAGDDVRLVAWVAPERGRTLAAAGLRASLREMLPDHMVPSSFAVLERLPRLPSGKVDRAALPDPSATAEAERPYRAPATATERALAAIWSEVLGRERIGMDESFFELGGHSIQSIQISHRANAQGIAVTPRDLLHHPTLAELAALVDAARAASAAVERPALVPDPASRHEPFPLSEIQQAYLLGRTGLFELGGVGPTSYAEIDWPDLDAGRLEQAWRRLAERHDMLRAVVLPDGRWSLLREVPSCAIPVLDLRALDELDEEGADAALAALREEMSHLLFEPGRWPLFDLRVSLRSRGRSRLHVARDLLIGDVRSTEILVEELLRLYRDLETPLPPLDLSIRDYALAVDALRESAAGARDREYWHARLPELPPSPELPIQPPPANAPRGFTRRHANLAPDAWSRLTARSARAGLTGSSALCAAFAEILARWSGRERFSINVLYSRRLPLHPRVERLAGNFATTVMLEVDGRAPTFARRAARLQERLWADLEHGLVSGIEVLREVNRLQGAGSTRAAMPVVFSSVLPFAGAARPAAASGPELVFHSVETPQVALEVLVTEVAGELRTTWNSIDPAFPPGFVAAMFEAWRTLLEELQDEAAWEREERARVPADQLERHRRANATAAPEPGRLLHAPIAEQAALRPDDVAVADPRRRLTYGELSRRADRLARRLRAAGAGPGRLVAIVMDKGQEQAVAALAVLRAGAAYLPIDPGLPRERRWYLLEQGEATVALAQERFGESLGWPAGVVVITVGEEEDERDGRDGKDKEEDAALDDLAYVLFTSGSTGLPKGVMIEHRGAANTLADVNARFGISAADRVLALSSLSFDLSVWDLFGVLGAGGRVVLPDPAASRDPAHWHERILSEGVTVWNSVPALVEIYAEFLAAHREPVPASLRLVLMSGDWIPVGLPDRLRELGCRAELISLGGATEASIWSILYPIGEIDPSWRSIPYGHAMANQTFHVLDERLAPCPDWVPGHLYIGGAGLARGYWKDEEKTAAGFFVHPRTGERLYRTGDLGRWLPSGEIEFLGREDSQVKIQGYRIELGEIEAALSRHPAVRDAVAAALGEPKGHKRLVAYWVPDRRHRGDEVEASELRGWLEARLPEYMVPSLFVPLESVPLTQNGKVDRRALPAPGSVRPRREDRFVAPRNDAEALLAPLWEQILGAAPIGVTDGFFELGGDSMLALRLLAEVERATGRRLSLATLFERGTIESLAAELGESAG